MSNDKKKFELEIHQPFSTFIEGKPEPIPYIIDGLLPQGALSVLGGKGKHGKSSMARYEAVCVAKGLPFMGRPVQRGQVLLCSLEDPRQHIDNCLSVLEYNPDEDEQILIVTELPHSVTETVDILADELSKRRDIKLIVLDTLAKVLRAKDSTNYDEMLSLCEQLRSLAKECSQLHIQALGHCKKVQTDDPFDGFLGSVEIRNEADTNIIIFDKQGHRVIQSETRMGNRWEPTILGAETVSINNTTMVKRFYLEEDLNEESTNRKEQQEGRKAIFYEERIVNFLRQRGGSASYMDYREEVQGNYKSKNAALDRLTNDGVIRMSGVPQSRTNPQVLHLEQPDWGTPEVLRSPNLPRNCKECGTQIDSGMFCDDDCAANWTYREALIAEITTNKEEICATN